MMNTIQSHNYETHNSITRLGRIADIIFALAMAQCFFAVDFPVQIQQATDTQILQFLREQIQPLVSYVIAFVIVGFYWVDNINQFKHYQKTDAIHSSIYLIYLMGMFLIPYADTLVIYFPDSAIVKIAFSINTTFIGIFSFINWSYATGQHRLVSQSLETTTIISTRQKILIEPLFSLLTIGVALINQSWWEYVWLLLPIPYLWNDLSKLWIMIWVQMSIKLNLKY